MWFYEERDIFGRWSPRKSPNRPGTKKSEGGRRNIRRLVKLPEQFTHMSLADLTAMRALGEGGE